MEIRKDYVMEQLRKIQQELKAPKGQYNSFGGYKYRSCEDILNAVKPLLGDCILTIEDDIVEKGHRIYIKATATLKSDKEEVKVSAFAREPESKKGMDDSQITGATSSYARKYALNGLFCIDDTKDADTEDSEKTQIKTKEDFIAEIKKCKSEKQLGYWFYKWSEVFKEGTPEYKELKDESAMRKALIQNPDLKDSREA